ncbi:MAG: dienelactone hydrolase family protein [Phycisphaerales bacterium]
MLHPIRKPRTQIGLTAALAGSLICATVAKAQDAEQAPPDDLAAFEALVYTDGQGGELKYRLLVPEKTDEPMPLLLFLHGAGERGDDNERQLVWGKDLLLKAAREYNCLVIAPQCPDGDKWSNVDWSQDKLTFSAEPAEPMRLANALIDELAGQYNIDKNRLYIMGLSMGGYGSWDAVCRWPGRFAATAPICGGGDPAQAHLLVNTPVWAFHGEADPVVSVDLSRAMIQAIKDAGGDPKYTEYPGVGHGSWVPAFVEPELLPWMMAQHLDKGEEAKTGE